MGKGAKEPVRDWCSVALEDYQARRAEVLGMQQAQQHTLTFGGVVIALALPVAVKVWDERLLAGTMLVVVIPVVSVGVVTQWVGQSLGTYRLGRYLEALEEQLRRAYRPPSPILTWEERVRTGERNVFMGGAVFLVFLVGCVSIGLGAYRLRSSGWLLAAALAVLALMLLVGALLAWGLWRARARALETDFTQIEITPTPSEEGDRT